MKEIFKQIISEFHSEKLPEPKKRNILLPTLPESVRKAFVYIGIRRCGKTWALYQRIHELIQQGIQHSEILYINFEDDRISNITSHDLQLILESYWELYPQHINKKHLHFFFDEIAEIKGWEKFIRRLLDKEKMQIYLSGSSAKMLSKEIATNLRGRTMTREIFPMDFKEYLHTQNFVDKPAFTLKEKVLLKHHVTHYLQRGGFPETLEANPILHRELLQGYMDSVIYRDIIERYEVKNHFALRQLLLYCLQNSASLLSVNKLFNQFKSRGISVSRETLYKFVDYFEDTYCLFSVPVYSFSLNKAELKPKKIYPVDTGLITAYSIKPGFKAGSLLETIVFLHLRRKNIDIFYYETQKGKEIDFLTIEPEGNMALYQVSLSLNNEETRQGELTAMTQAMDELNLQQGTIVTFDENAELDIEYKHIQIIPLWQFLLMS